MNAARCALLWLLLAGPAFAARCDHASGVSTAVVLELYTSEGCNSCPPADRWLARTAGTAPVAPGLVALAFHVDYWDYLGWKDAYARPQFTQRQKAVAAQSRARFVYTPQVLLDGRDYRAWRANRLAEDAAKVTARPARAALRLTLGGQANEIEVRADALVPEPALRGDAQLYLALTQSAITTAVKAGENRGVTLAHDHVVREWIGPVNVDAEGRASIARRLAVPAGARSSDLKLIVLAQRAGNGDVLQALAAPPCPA